MKFVADLHLHSKYSRACSPSLTLENLAQWAAKKGIQVLATGDWTHPAWFRELSEKLELSENGLYRLKPTVHSSQFTENNSQQSIVNREPVYFLLSTEISSIYSQGGKLRRIHNLVFVPNLATAEKVNKQLESRGANLRADGRPIIGLSSRELVELVLAVEPESLIIPAHIWTPHFSVFGSQSGFDSIEECFGEYSKYIFGIETGLSCYDSDTEVLTENGWKKFTEVVQKDKICTLNCDTEVIEYQRPAKVYKFKYQGKMYHLKTKRVDLLVTPNHNLLYAPADFHTRRLYRLKEARDLFRKSKILRKDGLWKGKRPEYFVLPDVKIRHGSRFYSGFRTKVAKKFPIEPWLKFFGFWIAEGWTTNGGNGDYATCVSNQNSRLMTEMKHILESFGYTVFWDKKVTNTIRVRDYQLSHYLQQFRKAADKYIPVEVKSLSKELLEVFFEYYIKGDGHVYGRSGKGLSATTISKRLRDDLQEIALKIGISAYYKLHNKKGTPFSSSPQKKDYKQSADSWTIYFIRRNRHAVVPSEMKKNGYTEAWVDYNGWVYCVSVPNRVVYIRRNGIPVWCGNSDPAMNWRIAELDNRSILSFSDAHSLPKIAREATVFDTDLSYLGIVDGVKNHKIDFTIEFFPAEGKYHYTGHRNCGVKHSPEETAKLGTTCPVCQRSLTVGVMHRVEALASRTAEDLKIYNDGAGFARSLLYPARPAYKMLVPLTEVLAEAFETGESANQVLAEFERLVQSFGSELAVLLKVPLADLGRVVNSRVVEGIEKVRKNQIIIDPGFDGVYGKVKIWSASTDERLSQQLGLF